MMMADRATEEAGGLPAPSPEMVLIRVFVQAYLSSAHEKPRRRARAFLEAATRTLADEESVATLLPIRPKHERSAVAAARKEAIALYRQLLPAFIATLPPE